MTYDQIAAETNTSQTKVWAVLTGQREPAERYPDTTEIRHCEGRWDYITGHVADLQKQEPVPEVEQEAVSLKAETA